MTVTEIHKIIKLIVKRALWRQCQRVDAPLFNIIGVHNLCSNLNFIPNKKSTTKFVTHIWCGLLHGMESRTKTRNETVKLVHVKANNHVT